MGILLLATVRAESGPQNLPCSQSYFSSSEKCNLTHSAKILGQFFTSYIQATLYFITERKTLTLSPPPPNLQDNRKTTTTKSFGLQKETI